MAVPILVEEIVIRSELLCHLTYKMKVLLGQKSGDKDIAVLLIKNLNPDEAFPRHNRLHKSKIEAPNHNNSENNGKWCHNNPILNIVDTEDGRINRVINTIIVLVDESGGCGDHCLIFISMVLFQERVEEQGALGESNQQDEEADVSADDREELGGAELLTLDVEVVVGTTVLAVDFLGTNHLRRDAVSMVLLLLTVASLDVLGVDSQEF